MLARGYLIIIKHDGSDGSIYPVTTSACSVGRGLHNDIRFRVQSVSEEHCVIYTSEFKPARLRNLSNSNPTEVNNMPVHENEHTLEHGDIITTGERSFRWEYHPQSRHYIPSKTKTTRRQSASPLPVSTGMVGMPISVLQSTLGSQPFSRQSVVITERRVKLSPALVATNRQATSNGDVPFTASKLVAVVSPQRRPQSEKKAAEATNTSSSVAESRHQSSAKSEGITPSNRKSSRLSSKSARKSTEPDSGMKTLQRKRSLQALVTPRKTHKSVVGTPTRSRIPRLKYNFKHSGTGMPQSSKKRSSSGNFKKMAGILSVRKTKSEQKQPLAATAEGKKRKLESGLRSAERAAKRLKLESPKTPDKKKMAALLVCHGKVSRPKTPQIVSSVPHEVANTSAAKVKSGRRTMTAASTSHGITVRKTAKKKYENLQTSVGDEMPSNKHMYSMEIPASINISSGTVHLNVAPGEKPEVKDSTMKLSQNSHRTSSFKTEQTVSPGLQVTADLHGINKRVSPVKVASRRKSAPPTSVNAVHTADAVRSTGRRSHTLSVDRTGDVAKLQITVSSDKKSHKRNVPEPLFKQLMSKSVQSTSAFSSEHIRDAKTSELLLNIPHTRRKSRSVTAGCPVTSVQTNGMYSSRKSGKLSAKKSPESGPNSPHTRKCSASPEIEQKARLISPSGTPVHKETSSRKSLRFSRLGVQSPESVESSSGSQQTKGKGGSVAPGTHTLKLTPSVRKSRSSGVTQAANSDEFGSEAQLRIGYKGGPVSSSTPAIKLSASTLKSRDAGVVGSSPKSVDQNSATVGFKTPSRSAAQKDNEIVSSSGSFLLKQVSQRISNSVGNLSSQLHEGGPDYSGSRHSDSPHVPKSSGKHVHRLSRSETSLNSVSPQMSVLAQGADIIHKRSSLKEQISQSNVYHTYLPSPGSQNTTFDFDCVETPCITLEDLVSPLSSNRKQKSLRWQDVSTSKEKHKSEPASKKRRISERVGSNVTFSGGSSVRSLPPQHLFTPLINGSVDTPHAEGKEWGSYNNSISAGVMTRSSYKSASPKFHSIQKLMKKASRISKTPESGLLNVSGVRQLTETPSSLKSSVSDMSAVHGGMTLKTTPRAQKLKTDSIDMAKLAMDQKSPKPLKKNLSDILGVKQLINTQKDLRSPRNDLRKVSGVKQLMKTPKSPNSPKNGMRDVNGFKQLTTTSESPKSPKNDLRDVRGMRKLLMTPKSPKSPKNDLRDVRGVRKLLMTPKSPKSPKNHLRDVRGVRKLMTIPKSPKSPKNDLRDVRGVRKLMTTPKSPKSPQNDLRDVRGVRKLLMTPKSPKSPKNDLRDVRGVRKLMTMPKSPKSPKNDLRDVRGVRKLMTTPKSPKSPKNDLRDVRGVRQLMRTPESPKSPKNDLRDVRGVRKLLTTPKSPKSPKNDLRDVRGVRKLMTTPKSPKSPKNDLRDVRGVRTLMITPKSPKSPKNDLRDVRGVRQLMRTPRSPKSPKNDLRDVRGVNRLMKTPKSPKSPENDLRDVRGVKRLMASPRKMKSPLNDLTDVHGVRRLMTTPQGTLRNDVTDISVKQLTKTSSPRSSSKGVTDGNDAHRHGKTPLPPQSPEFGGHAPQTGSTPRSIVRGGVPSVGTGTHRTRHGTKFINEVPEANRSTGMYFDQKTVPVPKDVKESNTRRTRNRIEPNRGTLQVEAADISPKPPAKKPSQKKNKKTESTEDVSPESNLEISPGPTVTSVASRRVHWNISSSPSTPGDRVTRRRNVASNAEVELSSLPPRTRKTVKSKGSIMTEESSAQKDIHDLSVSFPSVRKTRGRQLNSATEMSVSPTRRKQRTGVNADVEVSPLLKQKRGIIAEVESPLPSKRQQGDTAKVSVDKSSPRKRRGGTVNIGSEHSSSPKRLRVTVTEDTGDTVTSAALTSRRRREAAVVAGVEILHSAVTKKARGKLAVGSPVARTGSTMPSEDLFSASDKQPATEQSPSPPSKRRKQGTKPVEAPSPVPGRKLQGIKISDVGEEKSVSSNTRTRNKKPRITSSPVSKAKSPPAVSRRVGKKTAKKEVSPHVTTVRQTRAASRRKK